MKPVTTIVAGLMAISGLHAQTEKQILNLNERLESAWIMQSHQSIDALYCKDKADQYQIDVKVGWWESSWNSDKKTKLKIIRFLKKSDIEKLAGPQNDKSSTNRYNKLLDDMTKPQIMNGNSYIRNIPAVGILECDIIRGNLTRHDSVEVGLAADGKLLFTLLKRG